MASTVSGIARAAMLVSINIGLYTGRKQDTRTRDEVTASKGAKSAKAASVYKSLFADCKELDDIVKFQARARMRHYQATLPWSDDGLRLLPTKAFLQYTQDSDRDKQHFEMLVEAFLNKYDTLVAAAAFQLGTLFDRDEYPPREKIAHKFYFKVNYTPLPTAGDFRLDIESEVQAKLVQEYEERIEQQVQAAQKDAWSRLFKVLERMQDRLKLNEDGTRPVFRDSLIDNAHEICEVLTHLNVTNDPELEKARVQLENALQGVNIKELRKEDGERRVLLHKVNAIVDAFDWGDSDDDE